ncbi:hypothetical protein F5Y15DRAFT_373956 [Xylariaceae sp. FL0016]|nr:hypothetical protein F5Y15DRAFT_373956 [Xylariaceae sp. FL0016]
MRWRLLHIVGQYVQSCLNGTLSLPVCPYAEGSQHCRQPVSVHTRQTDGVEIDYDTVALSSCGCKPRSQPRASQ